MQFLYLKNEEGPLFSMNQFTWGEWCWAIGKTESPAKNLFLPLQQGHLNAVS